MSQKITVKDIITTEGDKDGKHWKKFDVHTTDGVTLSSFDNTVSNLHPGDVAEVEVELKGKYTNLKAFKVLSAAPITEQTAAPRVSHSESPELRRRSYALSYAKDMAVGKLIEIGDIIKWANTFNTFLSSANPTIPANQPRISEKRPFSSAGTSPPAKTNPPTAAEIQQAIKKTAERVLSPEALAEQDIEELFPPVPGQQASASVTSDPKTYEEFKVWCGKYKIEVKDIVKATGQPYAVAVKDISATACDLRAKLPEKFKTGG